MPKHEKYSRARQRDRTPQAYKPVNLLVRSSDQPFTPDGDRQWLQDLQDLLTGLKSVSIRPISLPPDLPPST